MPKFPTLHASWISIVTTSCFVLLVSVSALRGDAPVSIRDITRVWKKRQQHFQSVRLAWIERETITKGYVTQLIGDLGSRRLESMGIKPGSVVPPEDTSYDVSSSICLDEGRIRYERDDRQWSGKKQRFVVKPLLVIFDGEVEKSFTSAGAPHAPWPQALIRKVNQLTLSLNLAPILMTLRPLHPDFRCFDISTMSLTGRNAMVGETSCVELEKQTGNSVQRIWLDPSLGYAIVRFVDMLGENLSTKMDIAYRKTAEGYAFPADWQVVNYYPNGKLLLSMSASMKSHSINSEIAKKEFEIEFPVGTRVGDITNPRKRNEYIVKEGGRKRKILLEEIGASYEQMLNSDEGEALGQSKSNLFSWPVFLAFAILAISSGLLLWRRASLRKRVS